MIKFSPTSRTDFYSVLRSRINTYFQLSKKSKFGGIQLIIKTIFLLSLFIIPYVLILSGNFSLIAMLSLSGVMGLGVAGLGMAVMHDANHGTFSSNETITKIVGFCVYSLIIGGNPITWKIQHNILHHRYTNIYGADEDIEPYGALRFSPHATHKTRFRYQHIYSFIMYGLLTLVWALHKEFTQLSRYNRQGLIKSNANYYKHLSILLIAKCFYFGYILVIPLMVLNITFTQWLIAFLFFHLVSGLVISVIFQMAHVVQEVESPVLNDNGNIDNQWAVHQMQTTMNFAPKSRALFEFIGGLNYQIEHHLFPGISHIHYKKLAPIVQQTAKEFGIPYHSHRTFFSAIKSHIYLMKSLGMAT